MLSTSAEIQRDFAAYLRQPDLNPSPRDIEDRRLKVYCELIYNNIEGFISSGFPVLRKIYADPAWHAMIRDFVHRHESHSPYFLEIGREFIDYLQRERQPQADDPAFLLELATYEWAELAMFVAEEQLPELDRAVDPDVLSAIPQLSPLACSMIFNFPVHKIGVDFQPSEPEAQPVCLVVYRNRKDNVQFLEANPLTARLLELCDGNTERTSARLLMQIANETGDPNAQNILEGGEAVLAKLRNLDIIFLHRA